MSSTGLSSPVSGKKLNLPNWYVRSKTNRGKSGSGLLWWSVPAKCGDCRRNSPPRLLQFCPASDTVRIGNSGSPVLNGRGELIGLNFDRNWEGVGGDIQYLPEYQRSIIVDIRYVLFLIDKYGDAGYLIDEMDLQK